MPSSINLDIPESPGQPREVANITLDAGGNLDFNFNDANDTRVSINDGNGIVTIGGPGGQPNSGATGGLQLRDASGVNTIFLGAEFGSILLGGQTNSFIQLGNDQGLTTIEMVGGNGALILGASSLSGALLLRDGSGEVSYSIQLNGRNGNCRCVSLTETSDLRLKKGIAPLSNALDKVLAMRGVRYQRTQNEKALNEEPQIGFIGQEMESVCPEIVSTDSEGYKSLNYTRLTPILVEAIKEQQQFIQRQAAALGEALEKIARIETIMQVDV